MRLQDFCRRLFDTPRKMDHGYWSPFRDQQPDVVLAFRFEDQRCGTEGRPVCVLITPDMIFVESHYGAQNRHVFSRDKAWEALQCVEDHVYV